MTKTKTKKTRRVWDLLFREVDREPAEGSIIIDPDWVSDDSDLQREPTTPSPNPDLNGAVRLLTRANRERRLGRLDED